MIIYFFKSKENKPENREWIRSFPYTDLVIGQLQDQYIEKSIDLYIKQKKKPNSNCNENFKSPKE